MLDFLVGYLPALAVTLGLESLVVLSLSPGGRRRRALHCCLALNLFTHPLATLILLHANAPLALLEVVIVGVEYLGYRKLAGLGPRRAILLAVVANVISAVAGAVVELL